MLTGRPSHVLNATGEELKSALAAFGLIGVRGDGGRNSQGNRTLGNPPTKILGQDFGQEI